MATTQQSTAPEQRIVLYDVSWEMYEALLANYEDKSLPRFAYDRGVLEIVSPSTRHEETNRTLAFLARIVAGETGVDYRDTGSMTFKRDELQRGFEPDSSFYIKHEAQVAGSRQIDLSIDPPPDLVIEIDVANSSLNKLPIYAQMGVPEVWRYEDATDQVTILRLSGDAYQPSKTSEVLPPVSDTVLTRFIHLSRTEKSSAWLRDVQSWLRGARNQPA